jgi:hypothetical protein
MGKHDDLVACLVKATRKQQPVRAKIPIGTDEKQDLTLAWGGHCNACLSSGVNEQDQTGQ